MPLFPDVDILKGGVDAVESSGYDLRVQVERCSGGSGKDVHLSGFTGVCLRETA